MLILRGDNNDWVKTRVRCNGREVPYWLAADDAEGLAISFKTDRHGNALDRLRAWKGKIEIVAEGDPLPLTVIPRESAWA